MTPKENVFKRVENTLNDKDGYAEKFYLLNLLLGNKVCGIKILGLNHNGVYSAKLFKENTSIKRITYILSKWYDQQLNGGGGIVEYVLWEENRPSVYQEIISIPSRP